VEEALPVLRVLAVLESPLSEQELSELVGDGGEAVDVGRAVRWADRLQYVRKTTQGNWELDAVVRQAVQALS
jgi:hypothetical protein